MRLGVGTERSGSVVCTARAVLLGRQRWLAVCDV